MVCCAYLFVVDHERDGDLGVVGPLEALQALLAITLEVTRERVVGGSGVHFRHRDGCCGLDGEMGVLAMSTKGT